MRNGLINGIVGRREWMIFVLMMVGMAAFGQIKYNPDSRINYFPQTFPSHDLMVKKRIKYIKVIIKRDSYVDKTHEFFYDSLSNLIKESLTNKNVPWIYDASQPDSKVVYSYFNNYYIRKVSDKYPDDSLPIINTDVAYVYWNSLGKDSLRIDTSFYKKDDIRYIKSVRFYYSHNRLIKRTSHYIYPKDSNDLGNVKWDSIIYSYDQKGRAKEIKGYYINGNEEMSLIEDFKYVNEHTIINKRTWDMSKGIEKYYFDDKKRLIKLIKKDRNYDLSVNYYYEGENLVCEENSKGMVVNYFYQNDLIQQEIIIDVDGEKETTEYSYEFY